MTCWTTCCSLLHLTNNLAKLHEEGLVIAEFEVLLYSGEPIAIVTIKLSILFPAIGVEFGAATIVAGLWGGDFVELVAICTKK